MPERARRDARRRSIKIDIVEKMGRSSDLPEASEGRFASITVTDTGTGMDAETLQHAIEPFFTTKEVGKGTGLGLSSVHGLVAQLGGGMNVTSSVGQGTSVEMWIPVLAADRADRSGLKPDTVQASDSERTPTARILLVDDEPLVRMATKAMLEMGGHAVVDVASGSAALALLEDGYVPDILVTDQMMPGMRGDVLAAKVIEAYPDMRVLIATGYAGSEVQFPQIGKPYSIDQLLNRVQEVLLPAAT